MKNCFFPYCKAIVAIFMFTPLLSAQGVPILSAQEIPGWRADWKRTVEAAKKEGRLNLYITRAQSPIINSGVFQKRYPEIKILTIVGRGFQTVQRILAERRAGKYLADVSIGGVTTNLALYRAKALDPIKSVLILPEVLDESNWWLGKHRYGDPKRKFVFNYIGVPQTAAISYNVKLVNPDEFKTLWDIINPKWKGKIVALDVRVGGPGGGTMRFIYHHPELGPAFIRKFFGQMDVTLSRDRRQAVDWMGTGKFSICLLCSDSDVRRAQSQGLPVDTVEVAQKMPGLVTQGGTLSLENKAPHPNAARVFINWLLSRDGQLTLQKSIANSGGVAPDSLRIDISKDEVPPSNRRKEGVEYLTLDIPSRLDMRPIFKVFDEVSRK